MKEQSWACTLTTQLSLCIVAYIAFNIGQPQNHKKLVHGNSSSSSSSEFDMYFITVAGGFRTPQEQTLLLQQMAKVAKTYKARFVVDVSELGESDPLLQNATRYPALQNMPWYNTGASGGQQKAYFLKKIKIPYGQSLDIIALDTTVFQDPVSVSGNAQIQWLARTLEESDGDWRIVIGLHQLISCDYNTREMEEEEESSFRSLHRVLLQHGVDAYISMKTCGSHVQGGVTELAESGPMDKGPYLTAMNQNLASKEETVEGFLLHRVSSLEMVTYVVKLTGEIEHKVSFQQRGRAAM